MGPDGAFVGVAFVRRGFCPAFVWLCVASWFMLVHVASWFMLVHVASSFMLVHVASWFMLVHVASWFMLVSTHLLVHLVGFTWAWLVVVVRMAAKVVGSHVM